MGKKKHKGKTMEKDKACTLNGQHCDIKLLAKLYIYKGAKQTDIGVGSFFEFFTSSSILYNKRSGVHFYIQQEMREKIYMRDSIKHNSHS